MWGRLNIMKFLFKWTTINLNILREEDQTQEEFEESIFDTLFDLNAENPDEIINFLKTNNILSKNILDKLEETKE